MTVCQPERLEGFTQASMVMPLVNCRLAALLIVTQSSVPSKTSAEPYLPGTSVAPKTMPLLLLPEESGAVEPEREAKLQAPTRLVGATLLTVTCTSVAA